MTTQKDKKRTSMLSQIAILFVIGVILIGTLTSLAMAALSNRDISNQLGQQSLAIAKDVESYINEYSKINNITNCTS